MENPAGFWNRFGARLLDGLILAGAFGVFTGEFVTETFGIPDVLALVYSLLLPPLWYGYTLGRKALGNRIVKKDGSNVDFVNMVKRELVGGLIYFVTFGVALIISAFMVGLRKDKRAIHDFIGGTFVTKEGLYKREEAKVNEAEL